MTPPPSKAATLAVAMIARDEQDVVAESLQSVRGVADAVYVLDTGSSDRTRTIATALGANVLERPWTDDFAAARNAILDQISAEWILWLDAGERLDPASQDSLRRFVTRDAVPGQIYLVALEQPPADGEGLTEQVFAPRLMPNNPGLRFTGRARETLALANETAPLKTELAPCCILLHPRRHDPERKQRIAERNLRLASLEMADADAVPARVFLAKAEAEAILGRRELAIDAYHAAIAAAPPACVDMLTAYYGLLGLPIRDAADLDRRIAVGLEALERFPLDTQLLCLMGNFLQLKGRLDLAIRSFEMAATYGEVMLETWHSVHLGEMAHIYHALALRLAGRHEEAVAVLDAAMAVDPRSSRLTRHRLELALQMGDESKAMELLASVFVGRPDFDMLQTAARGVCHAARHEWSEALVRLKEAYVAGCREPFCLRGVVMTMLACRRVDLAQTVLRQWEAIEPDSAEVRAFLDGLEAVSATGANDEPTAIEAPDGTVVRESPNVFFRLDQPELDGSITIWPSHVTLSSHHTGEVCGGDTARG